MIDFPTHQSCTTCPLHETASHPGLPTRPFKPIEKPSQFALLFVGEAPGYHEDLQSQSWVGPTGQLLSAFITHTDFGPYDIYLSNSCRCMPPRDITPSNKHVTLCRPHLLADIQALLAEYAKVVIVCLGATASKSVSGITKLKDCFRLQGVSGSTSKFLSELPHADRIILFFSYHPAILLPGRKPALVTAVESHFKLVSRYCTTSKAPFAVVVNPHVGSLPPTIPPHSQVTVDIETYGILAGRQQSCFHPVKSYHIDHTRFKDQIVSVSFSTTPQTTITSEDRSGASVTAHPFNLPETQSYYYDWANPTHRRHIHQWFRNIAQSHSILIGQNILFDLTYMLINDSIIASLVTPSTIQLDDTLILSFFLYDQRPERGLKELSLLFGLADYSLLSVTGSSGTATGPDDPALQYYNMLDSTVTLTLYHYLLYLIAQKYGPSSPKLSSLSASFRSEVLWSIILLQLHGFAINCTILESLLAQYQSSISNCLSEGSKVGLIFAGKGSQKSMRNFFTTLIEQNGLTDEPSIERTPKTKALSLGANNTQTLMRVIPKSDLNYTLLSAYSQYVTDSKIENTYLTPLLTEPKRGVVYRRPHSNVGQCYPVWYPTPRESSNTSGGDGGTVQARFSCLAGETILLTVEGLRTIKDVVENKTRGIISVDTLHNNFEIITPSHYITNKPEQLYKVRLEGYHQKAEIITTFDHRLVSLDGSFITTSQLKPGMRLRHVQFGYRHGYPIMEFKYVAGKIRCGCAIHRLIGKTKFLNINFGIHIHHKDQNKENWTWDNLEAIPTYIHKYQHAQLKRKRVVFNCEYCGKEVEARASVHRHRFCSLQCSGYSRKKKSENYKVIDVTPVEIAPTYCLTIPKTETFVLANGIISGNCKQPAAQTFPPVVKTALCSRHPAGKLLWYDLSQMELRIAALLSGDPVMIDYYINKRDIHIETALLIDPLADPTSPAFNAPDGLRALGKTVNFLMLYRGGHNKLRETANKQLGLSLSYDFCQSAVTQFYYRHHILGQWQEQLIATARKQGYLELITGWGRTFGLGKSADSYINEICNFPVQTIAAQLLQSSQFAVTRDISRLKLRSCICLQVHDSLCVDTWPTEEPTIDDLMKKHLTHPPLLTIIENQLGRTVPIDYKKEKAK